MNTRQKAKQLERWVATRIRKLGLDVRAYARGDSGAGNIEKTDVSTTMQVLGQNAGIECKFSQRYNLGVWWPQTRKLEKLGYEPILAFKLNNETFENTKVVIYLETFLELIKESQGIEITKEVSTQNARRAVFEVEKARSHLRNAIILTGKE